MHTRRLPRVLQHDNAIRAARPSTRDFHGAAPIFSKDREYMLGDQITGRLPLVAGLGRQDDEIRQIGKQFRRPDSGLEQHTNHPGGAFDPIPYDQTTGTTRSSGGTVEGGSNSMSVASATTLGRTRRRSACPVRTWGDGEPTAYSLQRVEDRVSGMCWRGGSAEVLARRSSGGRGWQGR